MGIIDTIGVERGRQIDTRGRLLREYTYAYAVVAPKEGKMTSLILTTADTAMMNLFLEHVSRTLVVCQWLCKMPGSG